MNGFAFEIIKRNDDRRDAVALVDRDGTRKVTWESLINNICRIAAYARRQALTGIIPVYMDRGMEVTATILGLNLAGVGVAPLSITTPMSRCRNIASQLGNSLWTAETFNAACRCAPAYELCSEGKEADPAYIVFTSGSTGTPKGVMLSNEAILSAMVRAASPEIFDLDESSRMLHSSSLSFVVLFGELLAPLYSGSTVYVLPEEARGDLHIIEDFINRHGITCLFMSPQLYKSFNGGPSLRCVCIGGDKIANLGPKGHRLVGVYGMTEAAGSIFHIDITQQAERIPLGLPCGGIRAYVLDDDGNEAQEGELCISGPVALGYLGQEELTRAAFTPNPFSHDPGFSRLLHTGDIVRRTPDGSYFYLNRSDSMIKVNGQRVEPSEIEAVIMDFPGIAEAVVKSFTDENQHSITCAYYTSNRSIDEDRMKAYLSRKLPRYMVPSVMVKMDKLPLNQNGKLDRRALKMPDLSRYLEQYEKPVGEKEELVCNAFAKALGLQRVGRNDDFFKLGGDSITALSVVCLCEGSGISTKDIFAGRTPRSIAGILGGGSPDVYTDLPRGIDKARLTDSQMGVLLDCGLEDESTRYDIPVVISFPRTEKLNAASVKAAVDMVIKNHPALYAGITTENGLFYMVRKEFPPEGICQVTDLSHEESFEADFTAAPIAIGRDPLCQAKACIGRDTIQIFINMHHIVSDGSSAAIITREIGSALEGNAPAPETIDPFSLYEAERRIRGTKAYSDSQTYYRHLLSGVETDSNLIYDHKPVENARPVGIRESTLLPMEDIKAFVEENGFTENTFFMGVYGYALAKMTGQSESLFCVAQNGREHALLRDTVSMLVRTLPVVLKLDEEKSGAELLSELQTQFFATIRNNSVGFEELSEEYGLRSDVMFVYQSDMFNGFDIIGTGEALSNFSLVVLKRENAYELNIEYRTDMYERYTVQRFVELYRRTAEAFIKGIALKDIPLISETDRAFLDKENEANCSALSSETIIDIFKRSAAKYPEKPAIISAGKGYTYAQVNELSDNIASYLISLGIGRGDVVSVLIPRNQYLLIASLGVMKAGAAYQPLDPSYPKDRLSFMTKDAGVSFAIMDRGLEHILSDFGGRILYTDEIPKLPAAETELPRPSLEDIFVLLYTSGTTGTPKGVMLSHGNLRAFAYADAATRELDENSVVAQYASYGFDAHMHDLYPAVLMGCTVTIIPDDIRLDLAGVKAFCEAAGATHLFMTTQVALQFAVAYPEVRGLRFLEAAGEKLVSFEPKTSYKILNLYGPTEGTVCSTKFVVDGYYDNIPIGKAIPNYRLYVADNYGRRVPVGVPGELIQSGPQVGQGYLGRPEQTAKAFVANTFENAGAGYERCYKTGDIVRFINDGNLEYIGRRDHQVKIRGFRIEPGEVEKAIRDHPKIKNATVTVAEDDTGKKLCAYVVADEAIDIPGLNSFISQRLPSYMVPAVTMQIDSIPLNVNGKVDKKKLPAPELHFDNARKPENELEQQIFDCAAEAVGTGDFGIDTDIFMAGLSSIGSIRLCTLLSERFDMTIRIRDLKKYPTVADLEGFIRSSKEPEPDSKTLAADDTDKAPVYGPSHPLTKNMEGIFTECLQRPGSTVYNIPYLLKLGAGIDEERLKSAIAEAVEAHPCMKTELFTDEDGNVCQRRKINDKYTPEDVKTLSLPGGEEPGSGLVAPFELTGGRLFEISIIRGAALYLLVNVHHIISDGTSMTIFIRDIERAYAGEKLQEEGYSAFDVAEEEKASRTKAELKAQREYYEKLLEGTDKDFLPIADKPFDAPEASGSLTLEQVEADAASIRKYCSAHRLSMNAYFISVFGTVLARYAGTDYSVFNTVYNGRDDYRTANTVAMLVKTLPVVCRVDKDKVSRLTEEMASQLLGSMSNDLYSYAEISRELGVKNDVMFIFQGDGFTTDTFCGARAEEISLNLSEAKAPIALQVMLQNDKLVYILEYDPKKYTEALARAFVLAFDKAAADFTRKEYLADISLLSEAEEAELEKHNATERDYDKTATILDLFTERVRQQPEALCVEYKGREYTYAEIGRLTAGLSYHLMEAGVGCGDIVAILINRDENMVIGAYGVIRAGGAYLGLDPTYPPERLEFMIKDSGAKLLIADRSLMHLVKGYEGSVVYTDEIAGLRQPSQEEYYALAADSRHRPTPEDNALIVYSSGTTGLPKGSVLRHRNIICFYHSYVKDLRISVGSRVATYASFGFDGGAQDVFNVPMAGASLFIIPDEIRLDLSKLEQFYVKNGITSGFMTTQVGCMFISNTKCRTLKRFVVGGEKLIPVTAPEWVSFFNGYGPSETMCYVNLHRVTSSDSLQPIGKVSDNTKEYIVDKFGNRLPYGACGELCIAGGQVGKGYLNRPEKTAESFVKNPFCTDPEYAVMYKTGDIVRMLPDGNYDFVGRRDGQVKIRGFRIELSEIELQIRKYPGITNAVVRAYDFSSGGKYLAAFVVADDRLDLDDLKDFIGKEKPDYMIPAVIVRMDRLPLTSNGKVDAAKLPKPELGALKKGAAPVNDTEESLCGIFEEVLGIDKVYADDDFFKIGGSSISAIQVVVKCEQSGYPVVYKNLFTNPTPQKLASFIAGEKIDDITAEDLNRKGSYNYSALEYNIPSNLPKIRNNGVGDVLLTGATGFLGSHIFRELMDSTSGRVICLVRSKDRLSAVSRLEARLVYYFEDWYQDSIKQRTAVVDGELEDEDIMDKLDGLHFDTIINCAANVKHFAVEGELSANYSGVENLIRLAEATGARLIQISSLSVCGESVNGSVPSHRVFRETDLNIGQSLENKYIYTKYLGEQAIIDAVSRKRIRGKVIRLGNLMARIEDGLFQANAKQNGMLRMYLGCIRLGCFPVDMLSSEVEFSPIDETARAVVLLSGTPDEFTVFHAENCNYIHYSYLLQAIMDSGYPVEIVENDVFEQRLQKALENPDNATRLSGLLAYRNSINASVDEATQHTGDQCISSSEETRIRISTSNAFTTMALYRLGFAWPLISREYLGQMVKMLAEMDFFDD